MSGRPLPEKVHRRTLRLDGRAYTVLAPRPSDRLVYSTNRYHDTWHVLSDCPGGRFLGRLCWSLAYQRRPRTIAVIDPASLVPNPYDADPPMPIAIVNSDLGGLRRGAVSDLGRALPFRLPSEGTVSIRSPRLDDHLRDDRPWERLFDDHPWHGEGHDQRCWIDAIDGVLVLSAATARLRRWAVELGTLGRRLHQSSDAVYLDEQCWANGEVQVLKGFRRRVGVAVADRERLFPGRGHAELALVERETVWRRTAGPTRDG